MPGEYSTLRKILQVKYPGGSVSMAKGWEKRVKAGEKRELKSLQMVK